MRRIDLLEWLLIATALIAFAALGQAVFVSANAGLVHTLTVAVTESRAVAASNAASGADDAAVEPGGGMSGARDAIDDASSAMAAENADQLRRDAVLLAATNVALLVLLVAAIVIRARQISRAR